jgi:hypothetical protein
MFRRRRTSQSTHTLVGATHTTTKTDRHMSRTPRLRSVPAPSSKLLLEPNSASHPSPTTTTTTRHRRHSPSLTSRMPRLRSVSQPPPPSHLPRPLFFSPPPLRSQRACASTVSRTCACRRAQRSKRPPRISPRYDSAQTSPRGFSRQTWRGAPRGYCCGSGNTWFDLTFCWGGPSSVTSPDVGAPLPSSYFLRIA